MRGDRGTRQHRRLQDRLPDPARLRALEVGPAQSRRRRHTIGRLRQPGASPSAGNLVGATLLYQVATRHDLVPVVTRVVGDPGGAERDLVTLTVGALVFLILQTEVKLTRNTQGRWTFTMHKHPARDSTLGQVTSKLLAYLPDGK